MPKPDTYKSAIISTCGTYRYNLVRRWGTGGKRVCWVMLNPSTADATEDDPTIRRCIGFSRDWGFDELEVVNLYALRATKPIEIFSHPDPIGPEGDDNIRQAVRRADLIVAAWGANGIYNGRGEQVARMLDNQAWCLCKTKGGQPGHPLYVPKTAYLDPYIIEEE